MLPSFITSEFDNEFGSMNTRIIFIKRATFRVPHDFQKDNKWCIMYNFDTSCQKFEVQI